MRSHANLPISLARIAFTSLFLSTLLLPSALHAEAGLLGGRPGFEERMGPGGAAAAHGNTGIAEIGAQPAAFWNPGALALLRQRSLSLATEVRELDRRGGSLGASLPVGTRAAIGWATLYRADADVPLIDEDDRNTGTAAPSWQMHSLALGWRLSRVQGIGISWSFHTWNPDLENLPSWSSPGALGVGWFWQLHPRFTFGASLRNLGLNSDLEARFGQSPAGDQSIAASTDAYPRALALGSRYTTRLAGFPLHVSLDLWDWHTARGFDLLAPNSHALRARTGIEWVPWSQGRLAAGWDAGTWSAGLGWIFRPKRGQSLAVDYLVLRERNSGFWEPLGLGVRWIF